jgi:hypothetical protein
MSASNHARNARVTATSNHSRRAFGRTPNTYGPAIHSAARMRNHVVWDFMGSHVLRRTTRKYGRVRKINSVRTELNVDTTSVPLGRLFIA